MTLKSKLLLSIMGIFAYTGISNFEVKASAPAHAAAEEKKTGAHAPSHIAIHNYDFSFTSSEHKPYYVEFSNGTDNLNIDLPLKEQAAEFEHNSIAFTTIKVKKKKTGGSGEVVLICKGSAISPTANTLTVNVHKKMCTYLSQTR